MKKTIFYEPSIFEYELGRKLKQKFTDAVWLETENHNNIPELRSRPNKDFPEMKKYIVIGVRKTHKYTENHKISDYLVPYTSSGCSAACLYCYLVCNYNKCSYMRLFVNREQMMNKLIKTANKNNLVFEIGSNSDLVLENTVTENLPWTIENFAKTNKSFITFPTKFSMVSSLLNLNHGGKTIVRMSVNPQKVISEIELGTSPLTKRIEAINNLCEAGYKTGILIAPVIFTENWESLYLQLLDTLEMHLSHKIKKNLVFEIIFMTYSFIHSKINSEAFGIDLLDKTLMTGRGRGKYYYREEIRAKGEQFMRKEILKRFPESKIAYIV